MCLSLCFYACVDFCCWLPIYFMCVFYVSQCCAGCCCCCLLMWWRNDPLLFETRAFIFCVFALLSYLTRYTLFRFIVCLPFLYLNPFLHLLYLISKRRKKNPFAMWMWAAAARCCYCNAFTHSFCQSINIITFTINSIPYSSISKTQFYLYWRAAARVCASVVSLFILFCLILFSQETTPPYRYISPVCMLCKAQIKHSTLFPLHPVKTRSLCLFLPYTSSFSRLLFQAFCDKCVYKSEECVVYVCCVCIWY